MYKGLVKKLGVDNHMILGEKYAEAAGLVDIALAAEMDFGGHNVICILDQNMDRYTEGAILGTDVTRRLRECGFKGLIFIRSANDDMESRVAYKNAGADATLSKGTKSIDDLAKGIVAVRRRFLGGFFLHFQMVCCPRQVLFIFGGAGLCWWCTAQVLEHQLVEGTC